MVAGVYAAVFCASLFSHIILLVQWSPGACVFFFSYFSSETKQQNPCVILSLLVHVVSAAIFFFITFVIFLVDAARSNLYVCVSVWVHCSFFSLLLRFFFFLFVEHERQTKNFNKESFRQRYSCFRFSWQPFVSLLKHYSQRKRKKDNHLECSHTLCRYILFATDLLWQEKSINRSHHEYRDESDYERIQRSSGQWIRKHEATMTGSRRNLSFRTASSWRCRKVIWRNLHPRLDRNRTRKISFSLARLSAHQTHPTPVHDFTWISSLSVREWRAERKTPVTVALW